MCSDEEILNMRKLRTGILGIVGIVGGFLTLRAVRKRRASRQAALEVEESELKAAEGHARKAAAHAQRSVNETAGYVKNQVRN